MKKLILSLWLVLFSCGANRSFADFITINVPASSTTLTPFQGDIGSTTQKVTTDLVSVLTSTSPNGFEHEETYDGNAWIGELTATNEILYVFDETFPVNVDRISFWNLTDVSPFFQPGGAYSGPPTSPADWNKESGLKEFKLYSSQDGGINWTPVGATFNLAMTDIADQYLDPIYSETLFFAREQQFLFSTPFLANAMKIEMVSNHGNSSNRVGFAKVNFFSAPTSAAVPEPTSLCLFGGSVVLAGVYRRFRRRSNKQSASN
jgi:hypothetical protein